MEPIFDASNPDTARPELLKLLLANQMVNNSTDIHIMENGLVKFRTRGNIVPATRWEFLTDEKAKLKGALSFDVVRKLLLGDTGEPIGGVTKVIRGQTTQVRVQGLNTATGKKLFIRIQPQSPPRLVETLKSAGYEPLRKSLTNASGLVLVCGPIGSGKTTLAAALVEHWASNRSRHIATVEDPVEYEINPAAGEVSSVNASLIRAAGSKDAPFAEVIRDLLRSDIDGMFIGEARDVSTRNACLDFAATEEPVVTTVHAGGFADAVLRLTQSDSGRDVESLRHVLSQCLHAIIYVKLAYTTKGVPVPVITALPGNLPAVRGAIATGDPKTIADKLQSALKGSESSGGAPGDKAMISAAEREATEMTIREALPPEARPQSAAA